MKRPLAGLDANRLRLALGLFLLALALPTGLLVYKAYGQLKWETFHQYQALAEELADRIDQRLGILIDEEEARSFADYGFLVVAGAPGTGFLQRSPLSELPARRAIPGVVGYFQIDTNGGFSTPLLPDLEHTASAYGILAAGLERRAALTATIQRILSQNRLVAIGTQDERGIEGTQAKPKVRNKMESRRPSMDPGEKDGVKRGAALAESEERKAAPGSASARIPSDPPVPAQAGFDRLELEEAVPRRRRGQTRERTLGSVEQLDLDLHYQRGHESDAPAAASAREAQAPKARALRRERSLLPEPLTASRGQSVRELPKAPSEEQPMPSHAVTPSPDTAGDIPAPAETARRETALSPSAGRASGAPGPSRASNVKIRIFESELDPFSLRLLDSGHFVLYRKVWRDGQRYIQGALIEQTPFLGGLIEDAFRGTALSHVSDLAVAFNGTLLSVLSAGHGRMYLSSARELSGALLYRGRLSAPAGELELIFSVSRLPAGPGGVVIGWLTLILGLVLLVGTYALYRLGLRQIALGRQQQDFVSSVSHELKTPLTSIRMYGEMLREGWVTDARKRIYYDFICTESERLSRLINNVLQLARLTRNELTVDMKPVAVAELMEDIAPKLASQVEPADFVLGLDCSAARGAVVRVDQDFLTQILINLVDNAVKFSREAEHREVSIACALTRGSELRLSVRDYGPGIPADQMKQIFRLFYRSENELTRETMGTGIGLALVRQLTLAMRGRVEVVNVHPGAELRVFLPTEAAPDRR